MGWIPAIDVSRYQGQIDWSRITQPIAIIKISGGDDGLYFDSKAAYNYPAAVAVGKAVGGYHFAGGTDPIAEADFFIQGMSPVQENDVFVLDWEIPHADPVGWCKAFTNHVHDKVGVWPLIYMNSSTLNSYNWHPVTDNCGIWVANWSVSPDDTIPTSYTYVMQQYSDSGTLPNGSRVDLDAWFGTVEEFKKYGYHAPVMPTPTPAPPVEPQPVPEVVPTPPSDTSPVVPVPVTQPPVTTIPKPVPVLDHLKIIVLKALQTFWQAFVATWVLTGFSLSKVALIGAVAAGLSAVKSSIVALYKINQ